MTCVLLDDEGGFRFIDPTLVSFTLVLPVRWSSMEIVRSAVHPLDNRPAYHDSMDSSGVDILSHNDAIEDSAPKLSLHRESKSSYMNFTSVWIMLDVSNRNWLTIPMISSFLFERSSAWSIRWRMISTAMKMPVRPMPELIRKRKSIDMYGGQVFHIPAMHDDRSRWRLFASLAYLHKIK